MNSTIPAARIPNGEPASTLLIGRLRDLPLDLDLDAVARARARRVDELLEPRRQ